MDPQATRQRILEVAERHYAERGFDGMSMRTLTTEAGVNLAAVNYHFGSKKELIYAMMHKGIVPLNNERLELLEAARKECAGQPLTLEAIFDAFLLPVARRASCPDGLNMHFLRMVGRCLSEDAEFWQRMHSDLQKTTDTFHAALQEAMPSLSKCEIHIRFHFSVGAMLGTLVKHQQYVKQAADREKQLSIEEVFMRLRDFLCAGFRAGVPMAAV